MRIRIQDYNLTLDNLLEFPAWEYALDEEGINDQDERTVKPHLAPPPLNLNDANFIVRASFVLADGSRYKGYMKPKALGRVDNVNFMSIIIPYDLSPIIVHNQEHIHFQYGLEKPDVDEMQRVYALLGKKSSDVFPIKFSSDMEVLYSVHEGILIGYMYFDLSQGDFSHIKSLKSSDIKYTK